MYTRYYKLAGVVAADVRSDLAAIICGATSADGLSASADKVNTAFVVNTHLSTWTLHDAAASATSFVVRSLAADGVTYKYAQILVTASLVVSLVVWESWDATTHVGTNQGCSSTAVRNHAAGTLSSTLPDYMNISVSPAGLVIGRASDFAMVAEFTPNGLSVGAGYPRHVALANGSTGTVSFVTNALYGSICRVKNPTAAGDWAGATLSSQLAPMHCPPFTAASTVAYQALATQGIDGPYLTAFPLSLCSRSGNSNFFMIGPVLGVSLLYVPFTRAGFDEVTVNGVLSLVLPCEAQVTMVIPKV